MSKTFAIALAATVAALSFAAAPALAQKRLKVGTLSCRLAPSAGSLVDSPQRIRCSSVSGWGRIERYSGTVTLFGLDRGIAAGGTMTWSILMTSRPTRRGALAGQYVEASGDVSPGAGIGAKVLIGGSRQSTMLQPYSVRSRSVRARSRINLAARVTGLALRYRSE